MSRFQSLRSFKQRYGVPRHGHQVCVRVALARQMLLDGLSVAHASASAASQIQAIFPAISNARGRQSQGLCPFWPRQVATPATSCDARK
jgi:hypothetical protein